jgi:hypothetical protein
MAEGSRDLDQLIHIAMSVYYNRDLEKERKDQEKEKTKDKWQEALITALREAPLGQSPNQGHAFNVAILRGSAPRESYLRDPAPFVWENIGKHTVPGSQGN